MKFLILKSKNKQFYFVLKGRNGQAMFTSETYKRKASCVKSITSLKRGISTAKVVDESVKAK